MSLETTFHTIQLMGPMTALRESTLMYPIIMSTHLACIAAFGGMILMTNLRVMGLALKDYPVSEVVKGLRPYKHLGLTVIIFCGLALGTSKADSYYPNGFFWLKMTLLGLTAVHAIAFRNSVYRNPELDTATTMPSVAKFAAISSMFLWASIATMGRLIAYWE